MGAWGGRCMGPMLPLCRPSRPLCCHRVLLLVVQYLLLLLLSVVVLRHIIPCGCNLLPVHQHHLRLRVSRRGGRERHGGLWGSRRPPLEVRLLVLVLGKARVLCARGPRTLGTLRPHG